LRSWTANTDAGTLDAEAGIGIARTAAARELGLRFALAAALLLAATASTLALFETLLLAAVAAVHAVAAGLAAATTTTTVAGTLTFARSDGPTFARSDGPTFARSDGPTFAGRDNGRKGRAWRLDGRIVGRIATTTTTGRVIDTFASALAPAPTLAFASLAPATTLAFALPAAKFLIEDVVAH